MPSKPKRSPPPRLCALLLLLAIGVCGSAALAQERREMPKIAVYVTGDVSDNERKALGTQMLASLLNSGRYTGIAQSGSFGAEVDRERQKLSGAAMDDARIGEIGRRFGAEFVCVADITPAFGAFQLSARIVNAETARIERISTAESPLRTIDDLSRVSEQMVGSMLGTKAAARQAPQAAAPAPSYAAQTPDRSAAAYTMEEGGERAGGGRPQNAPDAPAPAPRKGPPKTAVYVVGGKAGKALAPLVCKALEKSGMFAGVENFDKYANGAADDAQIIKAGKTAGVGYIFVIDIAAPISVRIVDADFGKTLAKISIDGEVSVISAGGIAKKIVKFILDSTPKPGVPAQAAAPVQSVPDIMDRGGERGGVIDGGDDGGDGDGYADSRQDAADEPEPKPAPVAAAPRKGPSKAAVYVTGGAAGKILAPLVCKALEKSKLFAGVENFDKYANGATDDAKIAKIGKTAGIGYIFVIDIAAPISVRAVDADIGEALAKISVDGEVSVISAGGIAKKIVKFILDTTPKPEPTEQAPALSATDARKERGRRGRRKDAEAAPAAAESAGDAARPADGADADGEAATRKLRLSFGGGVFYAGDDAGISWAESNGRVAMPYYFAGVYLFLDAVYAEAHAAYSAGGGKWESGNYTEIELPDMRRSHIHLGVFGKYPVSASERLRFFPMMGADFEIAVSGKMVWADGSEYAFDGKDGRQPAGNLGAPLWFRFGGGADLDFDIGGRNAYLRVEALYGVRTASEFENATSLGGTVSYGRGLTFRAGVGWRL